MSRFFLVLVATLVLATEPAMAAGWLDHLILEIRSQQAAYHGDLANAVKGLRDGQGLAAGLALMVASLGYGVFHALGPGHGKAVIATYAATTEHHFRRAIWLSLAAGAVQATTAVVLVYGALFFVRGGARWATAASDRWLEPASYAAVGMLGVYILVQGIRGVVRARKQTLDQVHSHDHDHHDHGHDDACCHGHGPSMAQIERVGDWKTAVGIAVAVGIRPCSGAILVLVVANGLGLWAAGILSAYVMALGTAATVSLLAVGARASRVPLARLGARLPVSPGVLAGAGAVMGGGLIVALAGILLNAALKTPLHPLL